MNTGPCPFCGFNECHLLSTTNEWTEYCPKCDVRYNKDNKIRPADWTILLYKTIIDLANNLKLACNEMGSEDTEWYENAQSSIKKAEKIVSKSVRL